MSVVGFQLAVGGIALPFVDPILRGSKYVPDGPERRFCLIKSTPIGPTALEMYRNSWDQSYWRLNFGDADAKTRYDTIPRIPTHSIETVESIIWDGLYLAPDGDIVVDGCVHDPTSVMSK